MGDGSASFGPAASPAGNRLVFNHISRYQPSSLDLSWKQIDLAGGSLQGANIRLTRLFKRRRIAYSRLLLFPVGAHRLYREDRQGALLHCIATAVAILSLAAGATLFGGAMGLAIIGRALLDIRWIDSTVARTNKRLQVDVYMSQTAGAPAGYHGRFGPDTTGDDTRRDEGSPSFSAQERQLRDAAARRRGSGQ